MINNRRRSDQKHIVAYTVALIVMLLVIAVTVYYQTNVSEAKVESPPIDSKQQIKLELSQQFKSEMIARQELIDYYHKSGSRRPVEMAYALVKAKRPRLMIAMSVVESDGNYTVRNGGYKQMHHGAFQVNPKWWGKVPDDPYLQLLQAEGIIDTYLKQTDGDLIKTLNKYGGDSRGLYAKSIMNELKNVPDVL